MNQLKKQLGSALPLVILIAVILIIAGGVGYYFYKTSQEKKGESFEEAVLLPDVAEKVTKTETISGKQYRYYKFWVDEGRKFLVTISGDVEVWICYPDHFSALRLEREEGTRGAPLSAISSGYYYVVIQSFGSGRHTYTLTVQMVDETADWKTYRNDRYGYEVKYQNNWKVQEGGAPRSPTFSYHWNENIYCQFDIVVTPVDYGGEIAWYKENDYKETKYGIGGTSAIRFNKSQVGKNLESLDAIFFDKNSNYYRISLRSSTNKYEVGCNDVFNQILSTFKFIEKEGAVEKQIGYIKNVYEKDGKRYLDIDYVQYLSGEEAIKAMKEDGKCPADIYPDPTQCIPNGYYIRNQNPKIRTFEISKDAEISRTTAFEYSSSGIKIINYNEFKNLFAARDSYFKSTIPFHIEILNDVVVKITEQFIP